MKAAREDWVDGQGDLDAEHLIFIDESGLSTKMARLRGWAPKGERCRAAIPHGHWKTVTFVGGLTLTGFVAPMLLDGPMDENASSPGSSRCWRLPCAQATSSSWTIWPSTRWPASDRLLKPAAPSSLSAALQSRLQSDRKCLRQAQGACAKISRAHPRRTRTSRRQCPATVQTRRLRKLLRSRRIQLGLIGTCSNSGNILLSSGSLGRWRRRASRSSAGLVGQMPRLRRCNDRKVRACQSIALGASGTSHLRPLVGA